MGPSFSTQKMSRSYDAAPLLDRFVTMANPEIVVPAPEKSPTTTPLEASPGEATSADAVPLNLSGAVPIIVSITLSSAPTVSLTVPMTTLDVAHVNCHVSVWGAERGDQAGLRLQLRNELAGTMREQCGKGHSRGGWSR